MPRKKLYRDDETVAFSIRLPAALRERLEQRAAENRRSLNQEIVWLVQQAFDLVGPAPDSEEQ